MQTVLPSFPSAFDRLTLPSLGHSTGTMLHTALAASSAPSPPLVLHPIESNPPFHSLSLIFQHPWQVHPRIALLPFLALDGADDDDGGDSDECCLLRTV